MTDEDSLTSTRSFVSDDDETSRRTPSSLNNYSILPPIRSATNDDEQQSNEFLKHLQEKYQNNDRNAELTAEAKLDDAYLKMKRLDKALEEAFEKEKQVKLETMSLMKKLRNEMQSMTVPFEDDSNGNSHTQNNFKRFLALDDEILKFDDDLPPMMTESIFKTQLNDPLGESNSSQKSSAKMPPVNRKKKTSFSSNSSSKSKTSEKDFIKRNIQLAKELGGTWALTDDERKRLNEIMKENENDEEENAVALPSQVPNGYVPSNNEIERLKEIDDLLEREYFNPLLNHQLRRNHDVDVDYGNLQQMSNEENEMIENHFGERVLKETRLQREHKQRLKLIDEKLENLHRPMTDEKVEAILSDDQLNELLGQCAVDEMKQRYSYLNRNQTEGNEIDFNHLSDFTVANYVENSRGPMINDEIVQMLLSEAEHEGIVMRRFPADQFDSIEYSNEAAAALSSFAPAIDRPMSTSSITSDR